MYIQKYILCDSVNALTIGFTALERLTGRYVIEFDYLCICVTGMRRKVKEGKQSRRRNCGT